MRTGFCNPLNDEASHARCPQRLPSAPQAGACECPCHERVGVIWIGWDGEPVMEGEFRSEHDVRAMLALMERLNMIPPGEESGAEVVTYRDGEEWLA